MHTAFGRNWRDPHFAVCDAQETIEAHVFGDVVFRRAGWQLRAESMWRSADDVEQARLKFVFRP